MLSKFSFSILTHFFSSCTELHTKKSYHNLPEVCSYICILRPFSEGKDEVIAEDTQKRMKKMWMKIGGHSWTKIKQSTI